MDTNCVLSDIIGSDSGKKFDSKRVTTENYLCKYKENSDSVVKTWR